MFSAMSAADPLQRLEAELESVRIEFERYFLGLEKRLPIRSREEIGRKLRAYKPGDDSVSRFKYSNLVQRLQTLGRYWDRVQRSIEAGTYHRDVARADYREKAQASANKAAVAMRGSSKREADANKASKEKAAEVGAEAAAFLENLTGGGKIGMRGTRVKKSRSDTPTSSASASPSSSDKDDVPKIGLRGRAKRKS